MYHLYLLPLLVSLTAAAPVTYDQRQEGEVNVRADLQNFVIIALIPKIDGAGSFLLDALSKSIPARKGLKNFPRRPIDSVDDDGPDGRIAEQFLEPKTPYQVDITQAKANLARLFPNQAEGRTAQGSPLAPNAHENPEPAAEIPIPDVLPVENNHYVVAAERNGKIVELITVNSNAEPSDSLQVSKLNDEEAAETPDETFEKSDRQSGLMLLGAMEQCAPDQARDAGGICQLIKKSMK